jgi:uncharacterized protein (TIGR01777 family)
MQLFTFRGSLNCSAEDAVFWHSQPDACSRLVAPWERMRLAGAAAEGPIYQTIQPLGPVTIHQTIGVKNESEGSTETQIQGYYPSWQRKRRFIPDGPQSCRMEEETRLKLPGWMLGMASRWARQNCENGFHYRLAIMENDLRIRAQSSDFKPLRVLVTGSGGLIGGNLVPFLNLCGYEAIPLARQEGDEGHPFWEPDRDLISLTSAEPIDAVVHLAGENIAGRWKPDKKRRIYESRVHGTQLLCGALAKMRQPPKVVVMASATGYYGNREDKILVEESPRGDGFLAETAAAWEQAAFDIMEIGIRTVFLRFGMVLSGQDGALRKMLPAFRWGLGGPMGSGRQYWSWIALDDALTVILHALRDTSLIGPVNATSPQPVTQAEFASELATVLHRPAFLPTPATVLEWISGEMAGPLLLHSARVVPAKLLASGYRFLYPDLNGALRHVLGR